MWYSEQEKNHRSSSRLVYSSSSTSKSYSSPSSSSSSSVIPQTPGRRRSMDEGWKDISLATLHQERPLTPSVTLEPHHSRRHHSPFFGGLILQDFFQGAFKNIPAVPSSREGSSFLPPPTLPPTTLSLSSGMEFQPLGSAVTHNIISKAGSKSSSNSDSFHAYQLPSFLSGPYSDAVMGSPPPAGIFSLCAKKRWLESSNTESDPQHKRMIKNRESAARSRSRKQAYTNELELEVAHLQQENAKLRKESHELRSAVAAQVAPKKTLKRTSSATF